MAIMLCLLGLVASYFCWRGKLSAVVRVLVVNLLLILAVGCGFVPIVLLPFVQETRRLSDVSWQPHNTIVLLGAGTLAPTTASGAGVPFFGFGRILMTAQAYFACRRQSEDCKVLVSGGDPQGHGEAEAAVYARALLAAMVPSADVVLEDKSNNTWQNALNSTTLVPRKRQLVIVTSGFQLKRSMLYFSHFRSDVKGIASDELVVEPTALPSSINFLETDAVLHELIGIERYYLFNMLGLNVAKVGRYRSTLSRGIKE